MLEATSFRDWFYGTSLNELDKDKINVGVFNIDGLEILMKDPRLIVYPVWVLAPGIIRLKRACSREKNPNPTEICRRYLADEKDFSSIDFNFDTINNSEDFITTDFKNEMKQIWTKIINL